jgi:hypothetical protein
MVRGALTLRHRGEVPIDRSIQISLACDARLQRRETLLKRRTHRHLVPNRSEITIPLQHSTTG